MRTKHLVAILVLLALAVPASPAHAGGVVTICDEAHLRAALAGGGTVTFSCIFGGTIVLTGRIGIAADTILDGSGQFVMVSGQDEVGLFYVNDGVTFNVIGLILANGGGFAGTGIYNRGTLIVSNSTFLDNDSWSEGGGILNRYPGTVSVSNSTFSGNQAANGGGGIYSEYGTVTVSNSTFSGNSSNYAGEGGGIYSGYGTVTVSNSTFSGNSATDGGGIYNAGTTTLTNTIVANSPAGGNCYGPVTDGGGNLSYPDTTCPGINGDPILGPLQNNGGPTETMTLGPGSAAIDAGIDVVCAMAPVNGLDQRGVTRPQGPHCDIGAVEQIQEPAAVSLSVLSAQSLPGTIPSPIIAGLLLATLMGVSARQRRRRA